jgi:hypothetical protein
MAPNSRRTTNCLSYGAEAPAYWREEFAGDASNMLEPDLCVIKGERCFVRGTVEVPVIGADEAFSLGRLATAGRTPSLRRRAG